MSKLCPINSTDLHLPPSAFVFSSSSTFLPAFARYAPADSPPSPAPIITASYFMLTVCRRLYPTGRPLRSIHARLYARQAVVIAYQVGSWQLSIHVARPTAWRYQRYRGRPAYLRKLPVLAEHRLYVRFRTVK